MPLEELAIMLIEPVGAIVVVVALRNALYLPLYLLISKLGKLPLTKAIASERSLERLLIKDISFLAKVRASSES